ncbi:MAG: HD domain protein [Candidatus Nomurabacteria bacterium GW2011_GWC2_35_8]|uniref:HD domain protein n=1 Tax=Candidatus Nomurabacteria bacterium GW2011_GWC2_35_8 TaxID=1618752 RepID=A0A0G0DFZ2_9BACT|nr:MAG: HD domain protein [Candidatus Nomurabacteria bacterium GW2011_GWC2_35_8]
MKISSHIKKALYFAAEKHNGQCRKIGNKLPYIIHPVEVAFGVSRYTDDEEIIAAALLHDVLEDCPDVSKEFLRKEFSDRIAKLVDEVTIDGNYSIWKEKMDACLEKTKKASKDALIIFAVDKISNMQDYFCSLKKNDPVVKNFGGTPDQFCWYYSEIENILISILGKHALVQEYIRIWKLYKNNKTRV